MGFEPGTSMRRRLTALALLAVLGGCSSGGPYVYIDPTVTLTKVPDLIRKNGYFMVCHGDDELGAADGLAAETCADYYKLTALRMADRRYQCSWSKPHLAVYYCVNPEMRMADGRYVNPLNKTDVAQWQAQQQLLRPAMQRHGETPPPLPAGVTPAAPSPGPAELGAPAAPATSSP